MAGKPSPITAQILKLPVGKSCVVNSPPSGLLRTAKKHAPDAVFASHAADGRFVITRTA